MRRFLHFLAVAIVCAALSSPSAEAQGRNGRGSSQTSQHRNAPAAGAQSERSNNKQNVQSATRGSGSSLRKEQPAPTNQVKATKTDNHPANSGNSIRPGNGGNGHNNNGATRPGNNGNGHNNNGATRPGNNGNGHHNNGATRPGSNGNGHDNNAATRPGNNRPNEGGSSRPGTNANHRPNNGGKPGGANNFAPGNHNTPPPAYGYGPGGDRWHGNFHDIPHHAPHRPMLPPPPPHYYRPVPPPAFRPAPHAPSFGTILGVALGSAIDYTLSRLFNCGYYVAGYTNSAIYLNDVLMLNLVWPNATLQYNRGRLAGSEFVYLSPFYNTDRYYQVYNTLQASYGLPVSMDYLAGGGMQATWFGMDGRYVSLTYQGGTAMDGQLRYYTTLSFGN